MLCIVSRFRKYNGEVNKFSNFAKYASYSSMLKSSSNGEDKIDTITYALKDGFVESGWTRTSDTEAIIMWHHKSAGLLSERPITRTCVLVASQVCEEW